MQTSIFSQGDSLASHTAKPDSVEAQKMTATSGLKCLESLEKLNPGGLWERMFGGLLIGMGGWCSTRSYLTWKLKGTEYNRFYFQLAPWTHPIDEIESGLLPTPQALVAGTITPDQIVGDPKPNERVYLKSTGKHTQVTLDRYVGLFPTPCTQDHIKRESTQQKEGSMHSVGLGDYARMWPTPNVSDSMNANMKDDHDIKRGYLRGYVKMYPTMVASDYRDRGNMGNPSVMRRVGKREIDLSTFVKPAGVTGALNPTWVEWLMGYPLGWTDLKDSETQ